MLWIAIDHWNIGKYLLYFVEDPIFIVGHEYIFNSGYTMLGEIYHDSHQIQTDTYFLPP